VTTSRRVGFNQCASPYGAPISSWPRKTVTSHVASTIALEQGDREKPVSLAAELRTSLTSFKEPSTSPHLTLLKGITRSASAMKMFPRLRFARPWVTSSSVFFASVFFASLFGLTNAPDYVPGHHEQGIFTIS